MDKRVILGGDAGSNGCLAWFDLEDKLHFIRFSGKSIAELQFALSTVPQRVADNPKCYLEILSYRPGDNKHISKKMIMMKNYGALEGVLMYMKVEIEYTRGWGLEFGLGGIDDYEDRKKAAHAKAKELFPEHKITKDAADGILIALYGWRKENGVLQHGKKNNFVSRPGTGIVYTISSELG